MLDVMKIRELHKQTVERWHIEPIDNVYEGILNDICQQHQFNYLLWHEEDKARCPSADDCEIAGVKRAIDGYNQQRNDWIENVDDRVSDLLEEADIEADDEARLNSETPGSIIDRMSIMALRIYHLKEQLDRSDASDEHLRKVEQRIAICMMQLDDISQCLSELLDDIFAGRYRHRTYRQLKMYNDPAMNPYLYQVRQRAA